MKSRYDYNPNVWRSLQEQLGKSLILGASLVQAEMMKSLSRKSYPPASKPGEFPAYRTGNLRSSIVFMPNTVSEAALKQRIIIGYLKRAEYGAFLETMHKRLGLVATVNRLRSVLAKLMLKAKVSQ